MDTFTPRDGRANAETQISLRLTASEINLVLRALGRAPLDEVLAVFLKIKEQGEHGLRIAAWPAPQFEPPTASDTGA